MRQKKVKNHCTRSNSSTIHVNKIWRGLHHRCGSRYKVPGCGIAFALTGKKALHPVTFYAIQLSALFPQKKDFLASLKPQAAKTILWNS